MPAAVQLFFVVGISSFLLSACGVKGPPLPPIPSAAELSSPAPSPTPTASKERAE